MSRPWPLDVDQLLSTGTLAGPYRRIHPLTARRRAGRMVRALLRGIRNIWSNKA